MLPHSNAFRIESQEPQSPLKVKSQGEKEEDESSGEWRERKFGHFPRPSRIDDPVKYTDGSKALIRVFG